MRRTLHHCLALLAATLASEAAAADLSEIYALAQANDAIYAAARQARQAGLEKLPQGRAGLLPSVALTANASNNEIESGSSGSRNYDSQGWNLTLNQPLYRKANFEAYQQGKLQALQAEQQFRLAEQNLILRTAEAYFALLRAEDDLEQSRAQKAAYAEQLAQAKKSFEVGTATIVDSHEAQARFDLALAQEVAAKNAVEVSRRSLEKLIGGPAPSLAPLSGQAALPAPEPNQMDAWVAQAQEAGLGVALARTAEAIALREVTRQQAGHHPTLDLTASYSDNRNVAYGGTNVDTRSTVLGLELTLPLYQGGLTSSRVREAVASRERARFELEDARRQAALDARQAYLGVASGLAQVAALNRALVSSQAQLDSTRLGLEVGVRTRLDLLNTQQQLYTTRRDLAAARYQALLSSLQLKAAAATLGAADLEAIDTLLHP